MGFEIELRTAKWLLDLKVLTPGDVLKTPSGQLEVRDTVVKLLENGVKIALIVAQILKRKDVPVPLSLQHLKLSGQTAAQLYNWNIINDALKKIDGEIDSETKNLIINGDAKTLAITLRRLHSLFENDLQDSLEIKQHQDHSPMKESLSLSHSEPSAPMTNQLSHLPKEKKEGQKGDLVEYVVSELERCLKLTRKQAVALLSENNKYLAHVLVKGVKGQFTEIEELMERWFAATDSIVQRMTDQNDMCFFFLQVIKPALLSKSEQIAQWACRILSKIAYSLANLQMLPLAYDWFVREAGGLSTTALALTRHPKLNQHVVSYILEFARFNVAEMFTIQLRKVTNNDDLAYIKFILLIFSPLVEAKISSEELLTSGAIDYWVEIALKGAESNPQNSVELRMYCMELLTHMWRAYPIHIEETLDKVNEIMTLIKRGTRQDNQIMRFSLMDLLFNLLDEFASKKNPYASVVYKKLTFLFIETHDELEMREFMLRNLGQVFAKYPTIPVEIFLEPFVKQIKTRESKSYFVNIFDMEFIQVVATHRKLKVGIALDLFDLLAKTKLNSNSFATFTDRSMQTLLDRFLEEDIFFEYTVKLVKISLAMFYSTLKHKKPIQETQRIDAQKRAEIVNFVLSLIDRANLELSDEIKTLTVHVKVQIKSKLEVTHKGIERILACFSGVQESVAHAMQLLNEESESAATNTKSEFHLPKIDPRYLQRDETSSQQSFQSHVSKLSKASKQEFPQKDYTAYAEEDEKKFLRDHGIGLKKKAKIYNAERESVDPKIQEQIARIQQKKEEDVKKKAKEQEKIERKKEQLKIKIQKELQQRTLMQGGRGQEKDLTTRLVFEDNQINEKLFQEEDDFCKAVHLSEEENRDSESIKLVVRKHSAFLRKIFAKYSNAKVNKKDYFEGENELMSQVDLIRLCKQKGLQKNKQTILELLKGVNERNISSLSVEVFLAFLESLCVYLYVKEKCSSHWPMGDQMKSLLKRMATGENARLEQDQDEQAKVLTEKVRYNAHIELPENYKKITERTYEPKRECSYPVKKALANQSFVACCEIVNELLYQAFKVHYLEEEVRFQDEPKVVLKKTVIVPVLPKPKKEEGLSLLEEKQTAPVKSKRAPSNTQLNRAESLQKQNSRPKLKILNAVEKKRLEEEEAKRAQKLAQEEVFKQRQLQIKKRMQRMNEQREREKSKQKDEKKAANEQEEEKARRQREEKEKYQKSQKEKLDRYKKEQEMREKEEKDKQREQRAKQEAEMKEKMKGQIRKDEDKRKEEGQRLRKQKELSEEKNKRRKEEEEKKKEALKKQIMKKLEGEKEKYEIGKIYKELLRKVYLEEDTAALFSQFKEELRGVFNYGKEYNEFKLGDMGAQNNLEQKGWITVCQQLGICDVQTATAVIKSNQKEKGRSGMTYEQFQEFLLNIAVKKEVENDLEDYQKVHQACLAKMQRFLKGLKIPKDKQSLKEFFIALKTTKLTLQNPAGEKETWELQHQ